MSDYIVWAHDADASEIQAPSADKQASGWTQETPPHEWFNWKWNQTDTRLENLEGPSRRAKLTSLANTRPDTIEANERFDLPVTYVVGANNLQVYIDGILCQPGEGLQYVECGQEGQTSDYIRFNDDIDPTHDITVIIPTTAEEVTQTYSIATPGTTGSLGLGRPASDAEVEAGSALTNLPAFITPEQFNNFRYEICEVYHFITQRSRPGFVPATGVLVDNAVNLYPRAWEFLQTTEGQLLCVTEVEWQALSTATYYTNAAGVAEGWDGIGGVCKYVIDTNAGTIRVPDLRGMYMEAAGLDGLDVGGVHADKIRNIVADLSTSTSRDVQFISDSLELAASGAFVLENYASKWTIYDGTTNKERASSLSFAASRVVPTDSQTKPRAFGAFTCVYLGS